jgi:hypothetical protein
VLLAHIKKTRIRRDREWPLCQSEVFLVHSLSLPSNRLNSYYAYYFG